MIKPLSFIALIAVLALLTSCGITNKTLSVSYTIAHGYFVRNDAPPHAPTYYDDQESFNRVFGCAAVMGENGQPTTIDFTHQVVIAIIGSETNRPTEYTPISLTSKADTLCLKYQTKEASSTTYTMTPLLLLVVDKPLTTPKIKIERQ